MKALTFGGKGTILHETVPDPVLREPGDAIVKIETTAICGSDLHIYHERERGLDHGTVMGHEFVGEVIEKGNGVKGISVGSRVACPFTTSCGSCFYCRAGLTSRCSRGQLFGWVSQGRGLQGVQAEYCRVPDADGTLVPLPEEITEEQGIFLGDVLSTGYFCAEMAGAATGGLYAVLGCGPVGLMAIWAAAHLGARRIYAIDSVPERLALAEKLGGVPVDHHKEEALEVVLAATEGRGVDAVLEVVGSVAAMEQAYKMVRPGGTIAAVGVPTESRFGFFPSEAYDKNLTYKIGRCPARHYMTLLLPLVRSKRIPLSSIVTHRLPLAEGVEGYRIFDEKRDGCTKVLLQP